MNILIIDGNEKTPSDKYISLGMDTQYEIYSKILQKISNNKLNITVIHPAIDKEFIPKGLSLDDFNGIAWTGSVLNIYDSSPAIDRQIQLAKDLLNKENNIFGSCWGLQVLVTAAGGKVRKNPNGLEAIVAKNIILNESGINHPMYLGKDKIFDSFCWHYDETEFLPENSTVLASNKKSQIQSISFTKNKSTVWAVQYHPEFTPLWMAGLMSQRKEILLDQGVFKNIDEFNSYKNFFLNNEVEKNTENKLNLLPTISNEELHTLELSNWIKSITHRD